MPDEIILEDSILGSDEVTAADNSQNLAIFTPGSPGKTERWLIPNFLTGWAIALKNAAQQWTKAQRSQVTALTISSGTVTLNCEDSNTYTLALSSNVTTFNVTNIAAGANFDLFITQGGGNTITLPSVFKFASAPTITSTAGRTDVISCKSVNGSTFACAIAQNLSL